MKKIMLFAAACAALAACTKEAPENGYSESGTSFKKGETVTLTVSSPQTKVSSSLDGSTGAISFTWEEGDEILVTVGSFSDTFTLKSGKGTGTATFEGKMPGTGDTFDVQYPVDGVEESDLENQTYSSSEALPKDKMLFKKTGCTKGTAFALEPQFAALRLKLYSTVEHGVTIGKICVNINETVYSLDCGGVNGVDIGSTSKETAKNFFIVLPPAANCHFGMDLYYSNTTIKGYTINTKSEKNFEKGKVLNMEAIGTVMFTIINSLSLEGAFTGTFFVPLGTTWNDFVAQHPEELDFVDIGREEFVIAKGYPENPILDEQSGRYDEIRDETYGYAGWI